MLNKWKTREAKQGGKGSLQSFVFQSCQNVLLSLHKDKLNANKSISFANEPTANSCAKVWFLGPESFNFQLYDIVVKGNFWYRREHISFKIRRWKKWLSVKKLTTGRNNLMMMMMMMLLQAWRNDKSVGLETGQSQIWILTVLFTDNISCSPPLIFLSHSDHACK